MARGKKKETILTPEEKLQEALVPESEWPYKIPENWRWVYGRLCFLPMESKKPSGDLFKYIDIDSIDNKRQAVTDPKIIEVVKAPSRASRALHKGDTIFSMVRPYLKNIAYIDDSLADSIASTGFYVCSPKENIDPKYIYYLMVSPYVVDGLNSYMKGDNSPSIRKDDIEMFQYPLPPLPEQQRIVDRIESLFAKLDEAKEKAQAVVDGFEGRKAAILHKAFTGELTEEWRERQGISAEKWKKKEIGKFAFVTKLAGFEYTKNIAPNLTDRGIPLFKGKNVQKGELVLEFESYIPKEVSDELSRSKLTRKCLLTPYVGTIGNIAIFDGTFEAHLGSNVGKIEINSDIIEEFLLYYLRSDLGYKELTKEKKATAQESISIQAIRNVIVPVPMRKEQERIVEILDQLIGKEKQVEEIAVYTIEQIDTMKKSILARAFRGELGTNDPSDESAEELLKQIL